LEGQDKKFFEFEEKALEAVTEVDHKLDLLVKLKTENLMIEKGLWSATIIIPILLNPAQTGIKIDAAKTLPNNLSILLIK